MDYQPIINRDYKSSLMEATGKPRHHYWLGLGAIPIIIASFLSFAGNRGETPAPATVEPAQQVAADSQHTVALALPDTDHLPAADTVPNSPAPAKIVYLAPAADTVVEVTPETEAQPQEQATAPAEQTGSWSTATVRSGDSMARIFSRNNLSARALHDIMTLGGAAKQFSKIHPGDTLRLRTDADDELLELRYAVDRLNEVVVTRNDGTYEVESVTHVPERRLSHATGAIDSSLFIAAQDAGLNDNLTMELANIFGWDVDFVLDIRQGDQFSVLYEKLYLDGEFVGNGNILAAEFINRGNSHKAVRYTDASNNTDYFSLDGRSMRKAFLRTPVAFSRISSRFSSGRKHPVLNKIRAHKGVDYAAQRGVPIKATGSGKVVLAGKKGGYGNTVVLQHGSRYSTLYAHMSRFARGIRSGKRVQQGQVIGYIGSTGLATGPHLHYEFRVNGVHRNPLTVKLPDAAPIQAKYKADFTSQAETLIAQLETRKQTAVALNQP